jgi:hypothetical protein
MPFNEGDSAIRSVGHLGVASLGRASFSKDPGSPIIETNSHQARRSQFTIIRTTRDLFRRA